MNVDDYIEFELLGGPKELTLWNIYLEHSLSDSCKFTLCALFGCALPSKVRLVECATDLCRLQVRSFRNYPYSTPHDWPAKRREHARLRCEYCTDQGSGPSWRGGCVGLRGHHGGDNVPEVSADPYRGGLGPRLEQQSL